MISGIGVTEYNEKESDSYADAFFFHNKNKQLKLFNTNFFLSSCESILHLYMKQLIFIVI